MEKNKERKNEMAKRKKIEQKKERKWNIEPLKGENWMRNNEWTNEWMNERRTVKNMVFYTCLQLFNIFLKYTDQFPS